MTKQEQIKHITELLFSKYGAFKLNKGQTAKVFGISTSTLDRQRVSGTGIPYQQATETSNVYYTISSIAEYLVENNIKTYC